MITISEGEIDLDFNWFKTFLGMRRTDTIDGRTDNAILSFKQIVDNAIDDFMTKESDGLLEKTHGMIYILFSLFIEGEERKTDEPLLIDHRTAILGIPADRNRVLKYKSWLDKDPPTSNIYEWVYYIEDLNLITYGGGGTHRLAALNLYYRDQHPPFTMDEKKRCRINTERLNRYHLYAKEKIILYWIDSTDPLNSIYRTELTPLMFDMIVSLQIHYFGTTNFIDRKKEKKLYKEWQNRVKIPIEQAQELFDRY